MYYLGSEFFFYYFVKCLFFNIRFNVFKGKKIYSSEMKEVLEDMGIDIIDEGIRKLKEVLFFDGKF